MTEIFIPTFTTSSLSFSDVPQTASEQFKLYFYATVLRIISRLVLSIDPAEQRPPDEVLFSQFPFLGGYNDELASYGLAGMSLEEAQYAWQYALEEWERNVPHNLPIIELRTLFGLEYSDLTLFMAIGLIEEDARFGRVYATVQSDPEMTLPTLTLLSAWWCDSEGYGEVRMALNRLQALGLVEVMNPNDPRLDWAYQPVHILWDTLRGECSENPAAWCEYIPAEKLMNVQELILSTEIRNSLDALPDLLNSGDVKLLVLRGAHHSGRRTLLGALARNLGRGVIRVDGMEPKGDKRWETVCTLSVLTHSIPLITFDLMLGETAFVPGLPVPVAVAMGTQGGLAGTGADGALVLALEMPNLDERRKLWHRQLGDASPADLDAVSRQMRLPAGNISRVAHIAKAHARLDRREAVTLADVRTASRTLNRQSLETLAQRLETVGDWRQVSLGTETRRELLGLESRIRHREELRGAVGEALKGQVNCGVRALFSGTSGTGKTLAARVLASVLEMDIYRLDLSSVVNKYIGETEKNLNQVFSRAEELDVILLLDEGDSLLTQRTSVNSSNDRYANLETNFLLQRIESFQGVLIVTTNAGDRIDGAFQRRMDVIVDFFMPDAAERMAIWLMHLPENHSVQRKFLEDVASRCQLSGAQIRNAVLHASLLSIELGILDTACLDEALLREYRKMGAVCPLG